MMSFADGFARLDSPCMSFVAGSTVVVWYLRSEMMMVAIISHRIGLWENLQESPMFDDKNHGFL